MKDKSLAFLGILLAVVMIATGLYIMPSFITMCVVGFMLVSLGLYTLSHNLENLYAIVG